MSIDRFVLGTAVIGGLYRPVDDETANGLLAKAWESGVRSFDTAPHYGAGLSERRLGAFLRQFPRGSYAVSTKVGRLLVPTDADVEGDHGFFGGDKNRRIIDYTSAGVRRSLEQSLERLGIDRVDTLYVHDPEDDMDTAMHEAAPALSELRDQGVIRSYGAGMNFAPELTRFVNGTDADTIMVAGRYTVLDRTAETELLPACADRGVGIVAAGVYNSGILAEPTSGAHFNYQRAPDHVIRKVAELQALCTEFDVPLRAVAMQFPLRHACIVKVCVGARNAEELRQNVEQLSVHVPDELWRAVDAFDAITTSDT